MNVYRPDAELGVRLEPGAFERVRFSKNPTTTVRINGEGYRGDAWPAAGDDEIVVVGDSQVFGLGVEEGETFSAELARLTKKPVQNLGVPTYGPLEYNAVVREAFAKRKPKTIIWVANLANDLFEATRPNRERHAVWDGWAVRKETAPEHAMPFPGRSFLYGRSHAFYALRRFAHEHDAADAEQGVPSEGTWQDIASAGTAADRERLAAESENARLAKLREAELEYAASKADAAERALEDKVLYSGHSAFRFDDASDKPGAIPKEAMYRAARLGPGDIVTIDYGESSRSVRVTADHIRRGAALRLAVEADVRKTARAKGDKEMLALLENRDQLVAKTAELVASPLSKVVALSPLAPAIREVKALCDEHGARLLVVALPLDVQVSRDEWTKYGAAPVDMTASRVLLDDIVVAARATGARAVDATEALTAAEPGAFLDGDIHMTPKGHRAVAEAVARELAKPDRAVPGEGLPPSRSRPPKQGEWTASSEITVRESDPAGCETKLVREWLGVFCRARGGAKGVSIESGIEVQAGVLPGAVVIVAPVVAGQELRATLYYESATRELTVDVPAERTELATIAFSKPLPAKPVLPGTDATALCTCHAKATGERDCSRARVVPDADCARTYHDDCQKHLACAAGDPAFPPTCLEGTVQAGAARRCRPACSPGEPCRSGRCAPWQGGYACL